MDFDDLHPGRRVSYRGRAGRIRQCDDPERITFFDDYERDSKLYEFVDHLEELEPLPPLVAGQRALVMHGTMGDVGGRHLPLTLVWNRQVDVVVAERDTATVLLMERAMFFDVDTAYLIPAPGPGAAGVPWGSHVALRPGLPRMGGDPALVVDGPDEGGWYGVVPVRAGTAAAFPIHRDDFVPIPLGVEVKVMPPSTGGDHLPLLRRAWHPGHGHAAVLHVSGDDRALILPLDAAEVTEAATVPYRDLYPVTGGDR